MWGSIAHIILGSGPDNQPACLNKANTAGSLCSVQKEVRVVAGQRAGSQSPEHPTISCREEYCHAGVTSLLTRASSVWLLFLSPQAQGDHQGMVEKDGKYVKLEGNNFEWGRGTCNL